MMKKRSQLDRIFERGMADVSRTPQTPLSDERIAAAAKASKSGAAVWMRMHVKEILMCAFFLAIGIGGTLLVTHFTSNQGCATEAIEAVAVVMGDTAIVADNADVLSDGPATKTNTESTSIPIETLRATPPQTDQSVTTSIKQNTKPAMTTVETGHAPSLRDDQTAKAFEKANTEPAVSPIIVKKTIVQHDTVVINETVTIKDTVYLMEN